MPIARYMLPVISLGVGMGVVAIGSVSLGSVGDVPLVSDRPSHQRSLSLPEVRIVAQASASRAADCRQMERFMNEVSTAFAGIGSQQNNSRSTQETLAQIDTMITMLNSYISRLQAMQLTDPQMRQFRTRYVTAFQEVRQFVQTIRSAGMQEDEASVMEAVETFFQKLESYEALDESLRQYCGFAAVTPGQSPTRSPSSQQPTRRPSPQAQRPSSVAQRNTQTQQLNAQLQTAVSSKDWGRAIQIVDRLIVLHPGRASELQQYRARLVKLRNAQ